MNPGDPVTTRGSKLHQKEQYNLLMQLALWTVLRILVSRSEYLSAVSTASQES